MFLGDCLHSASDANAYQPIPSNLHTDRKTDIGNAIGVVRVVIQAANLKKTLFAPRPFVRIGTQSHPEAHHRTKMLDIKTHSPNWISESTDVIIYSLQENLEFRVMNERVSFMPSIIGVAVFQVGILDVEPRMIGVERPIGRDSRTATADAKGTILFDAFYYPVMASLSPIFSVSSEKEIQRKSPNSGIVTLRIRQAKDFIWDDDLPRPSKLVATATVGWEGDTVIHKTPPSYFTGQTPVWNSSSDFICFDKAGSILVVKITDDGGTRSERAIYGHVSVALDELLIAQDEEQTEWWPLTGCPHGALSMTAQWKPIDQKFTSAHRQLSPSDT
ncbi:hypothetical protein BDN70DRAFT_893173 [Pholiota conissans]|uniref:C2 domain-containing protein n=1 Tax=Pholiota conissans TaxID=109636 RepID=A0A9P5Z7T4_9AGAR|nr:hypothetical protein BDN70DRAFT_893173 [Pholiota conissans]